MSEDRRHRRTVEPADAVTDGTVVVAKVCVRPAGPVLRQVHEVINASRQQHLEPRSAHPEPVTGPNRPGTTLGRGGDATRRP